jgi:hypothetical protein
LFRGLSDQRTGVRLTVAANYTLAISFVKLTVCYMYITAAGAQPLAAST